MKTKNVVLVNTASSKLYKESKVSEAIPALPPLGIATIAGSLIEAGNEKNRCEVYAIDLEVEEDENKAIEKLLEETKPDFVGVSFTTATTTRADEISRKAKEINPNTVTIAGGAHVSLKEAAIDTIQNSSFDIAVIGEGDIALRDIVFSQKLAQTNGIVFKHNKKVITNSPRLPLDDIDDLPLPAWQLFKIRKYKISKLITRKERVVPMETSRGCPWGCTYCSKNVFGKTYRYKSPKRVIEEMKYLREIGFEEIHIVDDMFTTKKERAKEICQKIAEEKIKMEINIRNGIRADSVDEELAKAMKKAGVYRSSFGIESGNQKVLDDIDKGVKLETIKKAVKIIKNNGIESLGFFMLALPLDTEETMQQTIDFAKEVEPDIAKASICTPFPGTKLFERYKQNGWLKTTEWNKFMTHNPREVFNHPTLDWETIYAYYDKFYKEFYFRPKYILKRIKKGILRGTLLVDAKAMLKTKW